MKFASTVVAVALALGPLTAQSARAASPIVGGAVGTVSLIGVAGLIGNAVYLADGERSPIAWRVVAYSGGTISVLGGAMLVGLGIDGDQGLAVGMGTVAAALGIAEILVAIFAGMQPEAPAESEGDLGLKLQRSPSYGLAPLIVPRAHAPTAYGLSFSIQGF
jgi:hypothetical protein